MEIIKSGMKKDNSKKFECKMCGCIWKADKGEYAASSQMEVIQDGGSYHMECPCCGNYTYADREIN